jgi:L-alanine-DL-glutamate epimerase-like enolase superfamily enzyme
VKLTLHPYDLPLRHPFSISHGCTTVQRTLIVELEEGGFHGFGEAGANTYYGVTVEAMVALLERHRAAIEAQTLDDPATLWEKFQPLLESSPFAQCALDTACHDLWGKTHGKPLWKLWKLSLDHPPASNYTIGIDTIEVMLERLREFSRWPIYKIKLGASADVEIIRILRQYTEAVFRVDVNCAWTAIETVANALVLQKLGVEFIEQPLPADHWTEMAKVFERSALPIIADESCRVESDLKKCVGQFHGVNIKLVKCGGLTPARRMIERAKELGLKVMLGCMVESSVGISAVAQLLPLADYVDFDGALLLDHDPAEGVRIERGQVVLPHENGCGARLLVPN